MRPRREHGTNRVAPLAAHVSLGLLLVVATFPLSTAASSHGPPYPGSVVYATDFGVTKSCAHDRNQQPVTSSWKSSTGRGVFADAAVAVSCPQALLPGQGGSSDSQWTGAWYLYVPILLLAHGGSQTVNASWSFAWTTVAAYSVKTNCSGSLVRGATYGYLDCSADASASFSLLSYLVDLSAGTYFASTGFFPSLYNFTYEYRDTYCSPTCSSSNYSVAPSGPVHGSSTFTFHFSLIGPNAADDWELLVLASAHTYASISTVSQNFTSVVPLAGTARAGLDMATHGNGIVLTGIVVH